MRPVEKRNAALNVVGEGFWGLQQAMVAPATVLTLLLTHYGAGPRLLGAVTAIEGGLAVLPQIIGLYLFRGTHRRKYRVVSWILAVSVPILALMGLAILRLDGTASPPLLRRLLLVGFAAYTASIGCVGGAWMDWLAHLFHVGIRGTVMGLGFFASALGGTLGAVWAGHLLGHAPAPRTYALLYLGAAALAALSTLLFAFILDPADQTPPATPESPQSMRARFRASLADANFRHFLMARLLAGAGFCIVPFVAVLFHHPAHGGLSAGTLVSCSAMTTVTAALTNVCLGRLGDRRGHRLGLLAGVAAQLVTLVLLLTGRGLWACLAVYAGVGVSAGSATVSHNNMLFETCPHDHRLAHITVGNLVLAGPMFAAPLLAGWLADAHGLRALFAASFALSALAALWLLARVREPRAL